MKTISFAITVCNEIDELLKLVPFIEENKHENDEIVIQYDSSNVTEDVMMYLNTLPHRIVGFPLGNDFSNFKNNLIKHCTKNYIFQIDADEIPHELLMENIHGLLEQESVDLLYVPRVNTVAGITKEHIQKWGWRTNENGWINFPDYQSRIHRRDPNIKWINKVHEQIIGFKTFSRIPAYEELSLYHHKHIERQEKQNNFYSKL
jgi:glycosyltransferase involved in cell wall biosynthesis